MTDIEADLLIANARIKILEKELEERSDGCEFCLNGEHRGHEVLPHVRTQIGGVNDMRLILGTEIDRVREKIACPQLGDNHYGSWGALRVEQRVTIARMVETIKYLDKQLESMLRNGERKDGEG